MSALTGGNTYTLRPFVFASGLVSVGDLYTLAEGSSTVALGAGAHSAKIASVAVGNGAQALGNSTVAIGDGVIVDSFAANAIGMGTGTVIGGNCVEAVAIGTNLNLPLNNAETVLVGPLHTGNLGRNTTMVGSHCNSEGVSCNLFGTFLSSIGSIYITMVGTAQGLSAGSDNSVMVGYGLQTGANCISTENIGSGNVIEDNCTRSVILGCNSNIRVGNFDTVLVGQSNNAAGTSNGTVCVGSNITSTGTNCTLVGQGLTNPGSTQIIMIGSGNTAGTNCNNSMIAGSGCTVGNDSNSGSVLLGTSTIGISSPTALAFNASVGDNAFNSWAVWSTIGAPGGAGAHEDICFGNTSSIADGTHASVIIGGGNGQGSSIAANCDRSVVLGVNGHVGANSSQSFVQGPGTVGVGSDTSLSFQGIVGDAAYHSWAVWGTIGATGGTSAHENICFGNTSSIADGTNQCVLIGGGNGVGSTIAAGCDQSILLGAGSAIAASCTGTVIVGPGSSVGATSGGSTLVGKSNTSTGLLSSLFGTSLTNLGSVSILIAGSGNTVATSCDNSVVLGSGLTVGATSPRVIVVGQGASVATLSPDCIAIGTGATINTGCTASQAYGAGADVSLSNTVVFGSVASPVLRFYAQTDISGFEQLFVFDSSIIVANHNSAFKLLYKNALGNIVIQQVKVDPTTGALTVPL